MAEKDTTENKEAAVADTPEQLFKIQRIYLKDVSYESQTGSHRCSCT